MNKWIVAVLLGAFVFTAQAAPSQEQKVAHLEKALGISAQQATQVVQILDEQRAKFRTLHQKSGDDMPACEQLRALKKDTDARLATVLSADQIKKLRSMRHRHFKAHNRWRGQQAPQGQDGPPPGGPDSPDGP